MRTKTGIKAVDSARKNIDWQKLAKARFADAKYLELLEAWAQWIEKAKTK